MYMYIYVYIYTNCTSVFDHFVGFALEGLTNWLYTRRLRLSHKAIQGCLPEYKNIKRENGRQKEERLRNWEGNALQEKVLRLIKEE